MFGRFLRTADNLGCPGYSGLAQHGRRGASAHHAGCEVNMIAPQRLVISLSSSHGQFTELVVHSSRLLPLKSWIFSATPADAALRISLAFSLCRAAQRTACASATEAAGAGTMEEASESDRAWAVTSEFLREHACNLFLAWPKLMGDREEPAIVRALCANEAQPAATVLHLLRVLLTSEVFGIDPEDWLRLDASGLQAWCVKAATPTARRLAHWMGATVQAPATGFLPPVAQWNRDVAFTIDAACNANPMFSERPDWQGEPLETGALVRVHEHPLIRAWLDISGDDAGARMLARLVELAQAASSPLPALRKIIQAWPLEPGCGLAAVETSRGVLLHWVRLAEGRVADYRIIAPTEWNFHPRGVLRAILAARENEDESQARAWALALDPCVECSVELTDA
ncbi:Uptake hydrogenase large subunit (plasmid) [Methylovirgula sp. HY1]|nr:Uptake hydrogenase large subunit [Methylovirgula sp. HY1]